MGKWKKAVRARDVEDFEKMNRICSVDEKNEILYVPAVSIRRLIDNKGNLKAKYAEMVLHQMWCVANLRIRSVEVQGDSAAIRFHQPESRIQFEHPWPRPMVTTDGHNSAFYLTNARELQDVPGEWYHDIDARKVYYYPREGEKMQEAEVIVPAVETLVRWKELWIVLCVIFVLRKLLFPILRGCVRQKKDMYLFRQVCI